MIESDFDELRRLFVSPEAYPGLQRLPSAELRVWQFPSFETWAGWSVHRERSGAVWLRRITRGFDAEQPERRGTWAAEARVESSFADRLLEELGCLRLPAWLGPSGLYLDGTSRGVAVGQSLPCITIEWWEHGPDALRELDAWHARAIQTLDAPLTAWSALPWL